MECLRRAGALRQAPGAWTLRVAGNRRRRSVADTGAALDANRGHRLACAGAHVAAGDGRLNRPFVAGFAWRDADVSSSLWPRQARPPNYRGIA